jgi:CBS domain-containing protein
MISPVAGTNMRRFPKEDDMRARDVMVSPVVTVKPSSSVQEAAKILLARRISALPVVDNDGKLVGIVSEGDLMHRVEAETERPRSWWLHIVSGNGTLATEYAKAHARKVGDVMTREVVTASPETPLSEIAVLLEEHGIKRVPIVENGQLVGLVSRANLIQAVANPRTHLEVPLSDAKIRDNLLTHLRSQPWAHTGLLNVSVTDGVVDLWGMTYSDVERKAIRIAAETTAGVRAVNDHLAGRPIMAVT